MTTATDLAKQLRNAALEVFASLQGEDWEVASKRVPLEVSTFLVSRFPNIGLDRLDLLVAQHVRITNARIDIDFDAIARCVLADDAEDDDAPTIPGVEIEEVA